MLGLRPGELLGLKWSDRKGDVLRVQRSVKIEGGKLVLAQLRRTGTPVRCWHWRMLYEPAPDLCLANDLAYVHTDEDRRRFRHLAQRLEGRFCQPGVFLGIEQPEGMLD